MFTIQVHAEDTLDTEKIKVGVYEYEPYFMIDDAGNMSGYYYDFMELLQSKDQFLYEFVVVTLNEGLNKLVDGEIDIMLGIAMNTQLKENLIFNRYSTNKEIFGVFSNEYEDLEDLEDSNSITELKLGMVEGDSNAQQFLDLFQANCINVSIIYEKDYRTLEQQMYDDVIDLMIKNKWSEKDYNLIKEFIGRDVYIVGNKDNQAILDRLDYIIERMTLLDENPIEELRERYFGCSKNRYNNIIIWIIYIVSTILAIGIIVIIRRRVIKFKIRYRIKNDQYILQYQPIYNPRNNEIVAFEGLLRLLDKNKGLIHPVKIIPEIERNDMLFEVSLCLIEKVMDDYNKIKSYANMKNKDFYLSINISLKEIENDLFVDKAINILNQYSLCREKIYLEIIERFKMEHLDKITANIKRLRQAGFRFAIDDFGVENSNLDVFHKLNVDVIKVDKIFVDGIGKDSLKDEIVLFISRLADLRNQVVVFEGVEEASQVSKIKEIDNKRLLVQGFYYNKPMYLENIKML